MPSVGVLTMEIHINHAQSLKDKRQVVKSLKDRLRAKFNVAVAEIDYQDIWNRSLVTAVTVSGSHAHAEQTLQFVEKEASNVLGPMLADVSVEWLE